MIRKVSKSTLLAFVVALLFGLATTPTQPATQQAVSQLSTVAYSASVANAVMQQAVTAAAPSKTVWAKHNYTKTYKKVNGAYKYNHTVRIGYPFTVTPSQSTSNMWKLRGNEYVAKNATTGSLKDLWDKVSYAQIDAWRKINAIAKGKGWNTGTQYSCLWNVVNKESTWSWRATNSSSGAYGLYQSLPGNKMASAGKDWKYNPATQNKWGLKYMNSRYGSPCKAWAFWKANHWY
jgi:hypothetical protein